MFARLIAVGLGSFRRALKLPGSFEFVWDHLGTSKDRRVHSNSRGFTHARLVVSRIIGLGVVRA